eukprot:22144-Eustigmatos_ZCMA.PRE.1
MLPGDRLTVHLAARRHHSCSSSSHASLDPNQTPQVTVYESRDEIPSDPQESYPIGLNPRGVRAMDR